MPNYEDWNSALIEHVTSGAPLGSTIYLETSASTLERIGQARWGTAPLGSWHDDFLTAVRREVLQGHLLRLDHLKGRTAEGTPTGVAFLAAMVLAGSNMAGEANLSERSYFPRLCSVLGLSYDDDKHRGFDMAIGDEEPLWATWRAWLAEQGYFCTAVPGNGPTRYTNYPISQTFLRGTDRQSLMKMFREHPQWRTDCDAESLARMVLKAQPGPTKHVRRLLARTGAEYDDVLNALQELHRDITSHAGERSADYRPSRLSTHMYRTEDFWTQAPEYCLYPRMPRGLPALDLQVSLPEGTFPLTLERRGWFMPLGQVTAELLEQGGTFPVHGSPLVKELHLAARPFWIMQADPDRPDVHVSGNSPRLGETFLLLLTHEQLECLMYFSEQDLLRWSDTVEIKEVVPGWVEVADVMVTANHWQEVPQAHRGELYDALRPKEQVGLTFSGGLRAPELAAWLPEYGPKVTVHSFYTEAHLKVVGPDGVVYDEPAKPNTPTEVVFAVPGDYQVIATSRGQTYPRALRILPWEGLQMAALGGPRTTLGMARLVGPRLLSGDEA